MSEGHPSYDELLELIRKQQRQIDALLTENAGLRAQLDESRRAGKRQAAPFAKRPPKSDPKRPGRKDGHPPAHRPPPGPDQIDRRAVAPPPVGCPDCGHPLGEAPVTWHDRYQIDLPPPRARTTHFRIPVATCPGCDRRVQGRHPDQTSDALGAAAVQFGPNLLALAADLKHRLGVSFRKAAEVIGTLIGLPVSAGALARSGHRLAGLARPTYDGLVDHLRGAPVKHADETGWRIGGRSAWLWVFADSAVTVYRIRKSRGHDVVVEVLGEEIAGVLVSDCFLAYDPLVCEKQKCFAHLLKTCSEIEAAKTRGAVRFSRRVAALLRKAMALKGRRGGMSKHGYAVACGRIEAAMDRLMAGAYTDPDNARLAKRLRKHRAALFTFLTRDGVDATNNLAEREVRPAVIARKLSAGNRTDAGAETHAILASVLRTCRRQGRSILQALCDLLRADPGHIIPLCGGSARAPTG
jgi:transposase